MLMSKIEYFFAVVIALLFFNKKVINAQSFELDYQPIKSVGAIPEELTQNTKKKIALDLKEINQKDKELNKQERNFTIHSNYAIERQLRGGNILLNDEITAYVNNVVDNLLVNNPQLRKELSIYVTKVPEVNAYCMGKGYIFVNIGLISQVENEAQLAYVLAHEISHYVKRHNFDTYVEVKKVDKVKTFEDRVLQLFSFSKENELEADTYGFELFKNSSYSIEEVVKAFDVLKYSYLPIDEIPFDSSFFNDEFYRLPKKYFLAQVQQIKDDESYDDTKSTHPNISRRKENIRALAEVVSNDNKKIFITSKERFLRVRDICRFELCRLYLVERSYLNSITTAYILLKKYPQNIYLKKIVLKSLYAMCLYKDGYLMYSDDSYRKAPIPDYTKTEGQSQQLNYLLDKMPRDEMVVLSLKYAWKNHIQYPNDFLFKEISDSLFTSLTKKHKLALGDFYNELQDGKSINDPAVYYKYAFIEYLKNDKEFKEKFELLSVGVTKSSVALQAFTLPPKTDKKTKSNVVAVKKLEIKKVIVIDPFYNKIDRTLSETSVYSIADKNQQDLVEFIKMNAKSRKIGYEIIDPGNFTSDNMAAFNDYSVINDWFNERLEGGDTQNCPLFNSDEIPQIIQKYGTNYFLWSGVYTIKYNEKVNMLKHYNSTFYYSLLFDIQTGKLISKQFITAGTSDTDFHIKDYVEDTFQDISEK